MIAFLTYVLDIFMNVLQMDHFKFILVFTTLLLHPTCGVDITVDFSQAPDLAEFAHRVKSTLEEWFPNISRLLASPGYKPPEKFQIVFDSKYDGVAFVTDHIVGSVKYYREHQDDVGSMIHEMCHMIQAYRKCPSWLTEGIADYVRYFHFEPNQKPKKPGPKSSYTDGYGVTAYFLNYIVTNVREDMVHFANKDCREGNYADTLWPRLTLKSLEQLWADMMAPVAVNITVDFSQAPDLADFAHQVESKLKEWFPVISQKLLTSPGYEPLEKFQVVFDPNYNGVANAQGDRIVGSVKYYREHQDDVGSMIHEMCHLIQAYHNAPSWLTEGIADYVRYFHFEPNQKPKKPGPKSSYTDGYGVTAYFLNYIVTNVREDMVHFANKDCREGNYADTLWPRLTLKTLEQLWADMMAHG